MIRTCAKCQGKYEVDKSKSSLRLTYCNTMCEVLDLGFHLNSFINGTYAVYRAKTKTPPKSDIVRPFLVERKEVDDDRDERELVPA